MLHLRMPTTVGPLSRTRSYFSVVAQVFNIPPVRLRQVRGTSGLISSRYLRREDLGLGGVNAQTEGRNKVFNAFQSILHGFEAVAKQNNVSSIGEVRDRYGGAHLHTGDILKRRLFCQSSFSPDSAVKNHKRPL